VPMRGGGMDDYNDENARYRLSFFSTAVVCRPVLYPAMGLATDNFRRIHAGGA